MITNLTKSYYEYSEELVQLLKDVKAVLRTPETSVIDRYAGIADLARYQDKKTIGVLTIGLLDNHLEVRTLAADVLKRYYQLGETSDVVLQLLADDGKQLKATMEAKEQDTFAALINKMEELHKRNASIDGEKVDFGSRHLLIILKELGSWVKKLQDENINTNVHPLKNLLEAKEHRKSLQLIKKCLHSKDIYCRRDTILLIGELDLDFSVGQSAFDLILENIDRIDENIDNRNDYLVTWDGIQALTAIVQHNSELRTEFAQKISNIFQFRTYEVGEPRLNDKHFSHTRQHCVEALGELSAYEELIKLLKIRDSNGYELIDMMFPDDLRAKSGVKEAFVYAFSKIYNLEHNNQQVTPLQKAILDRLIDWFNSDNKYVVQAVEKFFTNLPPLQHQLVREYLKNSLEINYNELLQKLAAESLDIQIIARLLEERKNFVLAISKILLRINELQYQLKTAKLTINTRIETEAELEKILTHCEEIAVLMHQCGLQNFNALHEQKSLNNLITAAAKKVLWTLYNLGTFSDNICSLEIEEIAKLRYLETDLSCRLVLALFQTKHADEELQVQLEQHASSSNPELIQVCIEIERLLQKRGRNQNQEWIPLSALAVNYIPKSLKDNQDIPHQLAVRFLIFLAQIETPEATELIKSLITSTEPRLRTLVNQLREFLCEYHCYHLRNEIVTLLWRHLIRRHNNRENLRLDYLNLLRAGNYQRKLDTEPKNQLFFPQEDRLKQLVIQGIKDIQTNFRKLELPVLFSQTSAENYLDYCVVALDSLSPYSVNTLLYKVDSGEKAGEEKIVKAYLQQFQEVGTWVFLNQALTDTEIVQLMIHRYSSRINPDEEILQINHPIFGRVEKLDTYDGGVYVDIGFHQSQYKSIFVSKAELITDVDAETNWQQYVNDLLGSIIKFQLRARINSINHQIIDLELSRKELWIDPLEKPQPNTTVQASFIGIDERNPKTPAAIFKVKDRNKQIQVPLRELSWRTDRDWLHNWRAELKKREHETWEIIYSEKTWSLKKTTPKFENFLQFLYAVGQDTEIYLVYVNKYPEGYVFEIKPGKLCYIPGELLLVIAGSGEEKEYQFILNNSQLQSGSSLKVIFTQENVIKNKPQVILKVLQEPVLPNMLKKGMLISGKLTDDEQEQKSHLIASQERHSQDFNDYVIEIIKLPTGVKKEQEVSGIIENFDLYKQIILLEYLEETPDVLELDKSYKCKIVDRPKDGDSLLRVRHSNIFGFLYEDKLTYGHNPVIGNYQQGLNLTARVEKQGAKSRVAILHVNDSLVAQLGLEQQDTSIFEVIKAQGEILIFTDSDRQPVQVSWNDFKFNGDARNIRIQEGDRLHFAKLSSEKFEMKVEAALPFFTIKPDCDRLKDWLNWQQVLVINQPMQCIYVDCLGSNLLFEYQPQSNQPQFFAIPKNCLDGIAKIADFYHGDYLTLTCKSSEIVNLEKFEPGPLHFAAHPQKFADVTDRISWLKHPPATINQNKIVIVAKIINTDYQHGVRVELQKLHTNFTEDIPLRKGIYTFYRMKDMNLAEQERFLRGYMQKSEELEVILVEPPQLHQGKLWLNIESAKYLKTTTNKLDLISLQDKLRQIEQEISVNKNKTYKGIIGKYVEEQKAFQVSLDELSDCNQDNYCWLPIEHVSASLVHTYKSLQDFGDERQKDFTVISVNPELKHPELEVSLIENYPRIDLEDAAKEFDWSDNTILTLATILEISSALPKKIENQENQENQSSSSEIIAIEIKPGLIINVPTDKFFVEGLRYKAGGRHFGLQRGDQLTLRVEVSKKGFTLDVVKFVRAEFNLLFDSNNPLIVHGRINAYVNNQVQLKLEGYSQVECYLDPDAYQDKDKLLNKKRILFKASKASDNQLYFLPIHKRDLKAGDRLQVTYQNIVHNPDRLRVTFGEKNDGYDGYINKFEASYQPGFDLNQFTTEAGSEYTALVKQDVAETFDVKLSLKKPLIKGLSYFLNKYVRKGCKAVLVKNYDRDWLEIEIQPNEVLKIPYTRIKQIDQHLDNLNPGNILVFDVFISAGRVFLRLDKIEKSNLSTYLDSGRLVRVELTDKIYGAGGKSLWLFSLPDYGNLEGKLETQESFIRDIVYQDMHLKVNRIPTDPTRQLILGERTERDPQQMFKIESTIYGDRIKMHGGDGRNTYLDSYYATYRINNRLTYLQDKLQPGKVVLATIVYTAGEKQPSLRYDRREDEKRYNIPLPLSYLKQYLQSEQIYSQNLELTYVRLEGRECIFELEPGRLIAIPVSSIYFWEHSLEEFNSGRFLPGDIFTVRLENSLQAESDNLQVVVGKIEFSILHYLQKNQFIEAEVKEVIPDAAGIVIKAKNLELEYFITELLSGKLISDYKIGQSIHLLVKDVRPYQQKIYLKQISDSLSLDELLQIAAENDKYAPPIFYGRITSIRHTKDIKVNIVQQSLEVSLDELSWSKNIQPDTANQVLLADEPGFWVSIYRNSFGKLLTNPKTIYKHVIKPLKSNPEKLVYAQVIKLNQDKNNEIHSILLDVDGIRTLISPQELVRGIVNKQLPTVEVGMWVAVAIASIEDEDRNPKKQYFSVTSVINSSIKKLSKDNKSMTAKVCYTFPHGLVFSYQQALGYVGNEQLTWSHNAQAQDMFVIGDIIQVYEIKNHENQYLYSLKHSSQIAQLQIGQETEAEVHRQTDNGVYLKLKKANLFVFIPQQNINLTQREEPIFLRLEDVNNLHQLADFRLISEAINIEDESNTNTSQFAVQQHLDLSYLNRFKNLDLELSRISLDTEIGDEVAQQRLIDLLQCSEISCTYINIKKLMIRLNKPGLQKLWSKLAEFETKNELIYVLCEVVRRLNNYELRENYPHLTALSHYAIGILPILEPETSKIKPITALEHLLIAYRHDRAIDIQIALVLIYDQIGHFQLRQAVLQQIINKLADNLHWLLKLPLPLEIEKSFYRDSIKRLPIFKQAESIIEISNDCLYRQEISQAEQKLKEIWRKTRAERKEMPELVLNLAICRTMHSDWQGALGYLEQAKQILSKGENRDRFPSSHQAYYQLAMYVNYRLGRFAQVQNLAEEGFQKDIRPWLDTFIGYVLFASGKHNLSQNLILQRKQSLSLLQQNVNGLEHLLLYLHWHHTIDNNSINIAEIKFLNNFFLQDEQISGWVQPTVNVRLFPNPKNPQRMKFEDIVNYAQLYDVPSYAMQQYYQKRSNLRLSTNKNMVVEKLANIALSINELQAAENIFHEHEEEKFHNLVAQEFLINNFGDNQVANEESSGYVIKQLIERWIKSPYESQFVGQKLIALLQPNPILRNLFWYRQDLRQQLWQALDCSSDYGSLMEIRPTNINQSPLLELLIVLERQNLCTNQETIFIELIRERGALNVSDILQQLLPILQTIDRQSHKLVDKLTSIRQNFEQI